MGTLGRPLSVNGLNKSAHKVCKVLLESSSMTRGDVLKRRVLCPAQRVDQDDGYTTLLA